MYKRELKINKKNSFFLFGPRQVGKSTFLKQEFLKSNSLYYDFLKNDEYIKYSSDTTLFRKEVINRDRSKKYIILDEVQRIPEILNEVHYLLENTTNTPVFCLSGSSARKLKRHDSNMLGGRAVTQYMYPLSHREIGDNFNLDKALSLGTLPRIYSEENLDLCKDLLRSYTETYLQQEVKAEALVRNISGFIRFLKIAAENNGEIINYTNIARETGNDRNTVKEFFQILEDTLIGSYLFPFSKSARKRLISHPKFYFFDTGVVRALQGKLNLSLHDSTFDLGKLFEQFIILEIIKFSRLYKRDFELSFYRTSAGAEVDIIIESPGETRLAVEIKASNNPSLSNLKGLKSFLEIDPKARLICASLVTKKYVDSGINFVHWKELFEIL